MIGFIEHLENVTTNNYDSLTELHSWYSFQLVIIGFWRWCITFRNIEFSDSIRRPGIKKQTKGNTTFRKLDVFPSSGARKDVFCWVP
jgi:hypothetical protein